ncbi:thyrotropin-releasing hormone receptor-like [Gigantopelta aegis]|uniref:thyrotropin-releasing hormone receptor-like n=1 Tax=Gigantopelta aegis TaxID=1735272 RepID=UPI001B888BE2|nr:thyrotropin-releasing hormone receptor-like [Gigantopelta aegis]
MWFPSLFLVEGDPKIFDSQEPTTMSAGILNTTISTTTNTNICCQDLPWSNDSAHVTYMSSVAIAVLANFHLISIPLIICLGVLGNLLAFFTFVSKPLRNTSCSLYLAARSASDIGFLLALFVTWLGDAMGVLIYHTNVICQCVLFLSYVCGFLSVWLVVLITAENYIRICHPFTVSRLCTVPKAKAFIIGFTVGGAIIFHFPLWITGLNNMNGTVVCNFFPQYVEITRTLTHIDTVISLVIPSIVILTLMVLITHSFIKSFKRQTRLRQGQNAVNGREGSKKKTSPQAKVTRMLFAVSFIFLSLTLPSYIIRLRILLLTFENKQSSSPTVDQVMQVIFQIVYYLSFAVNLIVYLVCGDNFRKVFVDMYIACFLRSRNPRRKPEFSHTSFTTVRLEAPEAAQVKEEEETSLT